MTSADQHFTTISYQIMWTRLMSVVEEQAKSLIRTAFSSTVSEAGDLSAGIFDPDGRMIAQALTGTPGHVNSMAEAVKHFLTKFPVETMSDGDHFITNDPWLSSGHLHDVTVVTPTFRDGAIVGLFACCCHQVDIGGLGQGPDGKSVYEEGFAIPIMYLARKGETNQDLLDLVRYNVRMPDQVEGDIMSYMASNEAGGRHLNQMLDEFPGTELRDLSNFILERSRKAVIDQIGMLANGVYKNSITVDGYDRPVTLQAAVEISDDRIVIDYTGSARASNYGINLVMNYTLAYTCYGIRTMVAPGVPNNAGSLEPIAVTAPEGSILNVVRPAPVSARHIIGQFLPDLVLGCLAKVPGLEVPAEGASALWGVQMRGGPEVSDNDIDAGNKPPPPVFDVMFFNSGGTGARPALDGLSATGFPSGVKSLPVEAVENGAPIVIWRKEFRADSAGPGKWRGGLGQTVEVATLDQSPFAIFAMFDRVDNPARGRKDGGPGAGGMVRTRNGKVLRAKGKQIVDGDDRLIIDLPGGGGYGAPSERDAARIEADLRAGLISPQTAKKHYGHAVAKDDDT
jgi:N-methylhydantoinase B